MWCNLFGTFSGILAELNEQNRETSKMALGDMCGGPAARA